MRPNTNEEIEAKLKKKKTLSARRKTISNANKPMYQINKGGLTPGALMSVFSLF